LEVGAGRTGFANLLGNMRRQLEFHVQDITERNQEYLNTVADKVWLCRPTDIRGTYDIIFSTFVYEHMTRPRATRQHLLTMLYDFLASSALPLDTFLGRDRRS
jgi:hypothetical protein